MTSGVDVEANACLPISLIWKEFIPELIPSSHQNDFLLRMDGEKIKKKGEGKQHGRLEKREKIGTEGIMVEEDRV